MQAGLSIRQAGPSDASRVAGIHVRSWLVAYRSFAPADYLASLDQDGHRIAYWQPRLVSEEPGNLTWLAFLSGIPAGFANIMPRRADAPPCEAVPHGIGWLDHLHVAPELRGRGVGQALFRGSMEALVAQGFAEAVLWVYRDNAPARAFYERMGWRPDGIRAPRYLEWRGRDGRVAGAELEMVRYRGATQGEP